MAAKRTLGLIGYGAFGSLIHPFLAKDFDVKVFDETPTNTHGVNFAPIEEVAASNVVILATPVQALEQVTKKIAPHLSIGALVLDVGSVKIKPERILQNFLPDHVDVIGTHPLFGPQSVADGLDGLKIALCPIRGNRLPLVRRWLNELCLDVHIVSTEEHDKEMALAQGFTHLISMILRKVNPQTTALTTPSFDLILQAAQMVSKDSSSVFHAIESENPYAIGLRRQCFEIFKELNSTLEASDGSMKQLNRASPSAELHD